MGKRAVGAFLVGFAVASAVVATPLPRQGKAFAAGSDQLTSFALFSDALDQVRANYVVNPDETKLLEDAMRGVAAGLNPHAASRSPEQIEEDLSKASGAIALRSLRQDGARLGAEDVFKAALEKARPGRSAKPDDTKLVEYALREVVAGLDPHCAYLSAKEVSEEEEETRGGFAGIGVVMDMESGGAKVVEVLDNTPAARAGVLAGDLIIAIDGKSLRGLSLSAAGDKLSGPTGSSVTLTLARNGLGKPIAVKAARDIIRVEPVRYRIEGDVGWIKVTSFGYRYTADHVRWALQDIKKALGTKLAGYVLDLRNNPGGLLDQAVAVADAFLDSGAIVTTKGRSVSDVHRADATSGDLTDGMPLVVLINGGTASAAEIVAGALQDNNRATIVGTRSFGKGSVQTLIPLANKGAIRLTTARYYTPSGRSIQAAGIEPDYDLKPEIAPNLKLELAALTVESEAQLRGHLQNDGVQEEPAAALMCRKIKIKMTSSMRRWRSSTPSHQALELGFRRAAQTSRHLRVLITYR